MLDEACIERYSRQIILPQVGGKGQEKLLGSRVLVDGPAERRNATTAGAEHGLFQAAALLYLTAAGTGTIGVTRAANVPVLSALAGVQASTAVQADAPRLVKTLRRLNPDCTIINHADAPTARQCREYDVVLGADGRLHDVCHAQRTPFVWASVACGQPSVGQLFVSRPDRPDWPCLRCVFPAGTPAGIVANATLPPAALAVRCAALVALFVGAQQATEALKIIVRADVDSRPSLTTYDVSSFRCTTEPAARDPGCPRCSSTPS